MGTPSLPLVCGLLKTNEDPEQVDPQVFLYFSLPIYSFIRFLLSLLRNSLDREGATCNQKLLNQAYLLEKYKKNGFKKWIYDFWYIQLII